MSIFDLWVKGCEINKTLLYRLEGNKDTALYKTISQHLVKHNFYYDTPVYHVWVKGKRLIATTSYLEAYHKWESATKTGIMEKGVKCNENIC